MAFFDWNDDGKKNWKDNFIEYQVFQDCNETDPEPPRPHNKLTSEQREVGFTLFVILIGIVIMVMIFSRACTAITSPKTYTSTYTSSRAAEISKEAAEIKARRESREAASSAAASATTSTKAASTTKAATTSTKAATSSTKSSTTKKDKYGAKNYTFAEDFYEDHYDDFDSFEAAEDYFNSMR